MNLFELRFGSTETAWDAWRNEQVEEVGIEVGTYVGRTEFRVDPLPYCSQQEYITTLEPRETIDLLSQGV